MRGSPPVQLTLLLLGFLALGVPLVRLTSGGTSALAAATSASDTVRIPVHFRIRYQTRPAKLVARVGGLDLLKSATVSAMAAEGRVDIALDQGGLDLSILAEWPAGSPDSVLTVDFEPDKMEGRSRFLWSLDGKIEDTLAFTWPP